MYNIYKSSQKSRIKFDEVQCKIMDLDADVFSVNETWLDGTISNAEIAIDGWYNVFRNDRNRRGGGSLLYSLCVFEYFKNIF